MEVSTGMACHLAPRIDGEGERFLGSKCTMVSVKYIYYERHRYGQCRSHAPPTKGIKDLTGTSGSIRTVPAAEGLTIFAYDKYHLRYPSDTAQQHVAL